MILQRQKREISGPAFIIVVLVVANIVVLVWQLPNLAPSAVGDFLSNVFQPVVSVCIAAICGAWLGVAEAPLPRSRTCGLVIQLAAIVVAYIIAHVLFSTFTQSASLVVNIVDSKNAVIRDRLEIQVIGSTRRTETTDTGQATFQHLYQGDQTRRIDVVVIVTKLGESARYDQRHVCAKHQVPLQESVF